MTELDDEVIPEDPGPDPRGGRLKGEWLRRFETIMTSPGRFFRIRIMKNFAGGRNAASLLRKGKFKLPEGDFEITSRPGKQGTELEGKGLVYAKYLGKARKG